MLAMAGTPKTIATRNVGGRPLLSAAAGAKSRETRGQEGPKAALKREHGRKRTFPGELETKANGRRGQRAGMLSRSWLRFVLIVALNLATGPARVNSPQVRPAHLGLILPHESVPGPKR